MRVRKTVLILAGAVGALLAGLAVRRGRAATPLPDVRTGSCANGMEYSVVGSGSKTLLFIQGGPGTAVPSPTEMRVMARSVKPYVDDGFTVWAVTRRRGMPSGYTVSEMAEDYARTIRDELGGRVDLVVAEEFGGMIGQQLAADHPELLTHLALVRTAWRITEWGRDSDGRFGEALSSGRFAAAGAALLEEVVPGGRWLWLRRLLGPLVGRWLAGRAYHLPDVLVEAHAERDFDGRDALPRITAPVVLICGEDDRVFAEADARETVRLVPDGTFIRYAGASGLRAAASPRVPRDVLAFVNRNR